MKCECTKDGFCSKFGRPMVGVLRKICAGEACDATDEQRARISGWIESQTRPQNKTPRKARQRQSNHREKVGTALASRIEGLLKLKSVKGCGCGKLAAQMDAWGISGCEQHRQEIVAALVKNRDVLVNAMASQGWLIGVVASLIPDALMQRGAEWLLDMALADVRSQPRQSLRMPRQTSGAIGRRSKATGRETIEFTPDPEWASKIRHLTFHIWPTKKHDGWKWNLQQLAKRWQVFNGKKVLGLVLDPDTETFDTVTQYAESIGVRFDHVIVKANDSKLREVVTWLPMIDWLNIASMGPSDVVFSAHAKGVRHDTMTSALSRWTEIMYATCLDDMKAIEQSLKNHIATGSFKRYGMFPTAGNKKWHYSGTFFWWRPQEISRMNWRSVDQKFFGTESWLGRLLYQNQADCLFWDSCGDLYKQHYWDEAVWPAWLKSNWAAAGLLEAMDG